MRLADEARAVDDVGLALDDRLDELGILRGVVFEVGVLDDDDLAGGVAEPGPQGRSLALVLVVEDDRQLGLVAGQLLRMSRVPSVEQSSTRMICFGTARRGPGGGSRGCVRLVVDGDDDREHRSSGIR